VLVHHCLSNHAPSHTGAYTGGTARLPSSA
jgi:hypothetical protein